MNTPIEDTSHQSPHSGRFCGVPSYFRACCAEASHGGSSGYDHPAYHLAIHVEGLIPDDMLARDWFAIVEELRDLVKTEDDETVLAWFDSHFPRCMELVPNRRRPQFLKGVYDAFEAGQL